jgi:hypothetical protein
VNLKGPTVDRSFSRFQIHNHTSSIEKGIACGTEEQGGIRCRFGAEWSGLFWRRVIRFDNALLGSLWRGLGEEVGSENDT